MDTPETPPPNTPAPPVLTIRVWADTVSRGHVETCRGKHCKAPLWFARSVANNRAVPFDGKQEYVSTDAEAGTGRPIWVVDRRRVHFGNCPDVNRFRK